MHLFLSSKSFARTRRDMGATPVDKNHVEKHHPADCESCYAEPPEPLTETTNTQHVSLFFVDGERSIDYVLVWKTVADDPVQEDINCTKRAIFEDNLVNEGLELERESIDQFNFTKIHTPIEVLRRYSEILKLRMPMKEVICECTHRHTNNWHIFCTNSLIVFNQHHSIFFSVIMFY